MATVQLSQRPLLVFAGAIVLQVVLISAQVGTTAGIPFIQVVTFGAFAEVQRGTMNAVDSVTGVWSGYVDLRAVQEENERLKRENAELQVRLQETRAQAQRTENLRQLLELRQRAGLNTVAAEIIAGPAVAEFRDMTIDKGSSDGLKPDMAVISPAGVVGRVILPSRRAARVQMLIDRNAAAGAMIERTRAQGLVVGQGDGLRMEYVPNTADVKQGDLVVTSGIDKIYPKGFVIGTVESVERGPSTFYTVVVRPAVDFTRLEEVLVVTTPPPAVAPEDLEPLPPSRPTAATNATPSAPQQRPAAASQNRSGAAPVRPAANRPPAAPRNQPAPAPRPQNQEPPVPQTPRPNPPQNGGPAGPAGGTLAPASPPGGTVR
jgi:rod shape-determining protein MreC